MRILATVAAFLLLSANLQAQTSLGVGETHTSLNANASATPQTGTAFAVPGSVNTITWNISFASAPASQTTILETSNDNSVWATADTSTAVGGESRTIFTVARFIRTTESARSGGGAITTTLVGRSSPVTNTDLTLASDVSVRSITLNNTVAPVIRIPNNIYMQGRNNANSAWVNMISIGPTDQVFIGANMAAADITGGSITATNGISSTNNVSAGSAGFFGFATKSNFNSPADGLINANRNLATVVGVQMNIGTAIPTSTPCTFTAHSTNTAGQMTAVGVATCTITFGSPAWSFTPFCIATEVTAARALFISAASTTAITVSGLTAGDLFNYICLGGAF